MPVSRAQLLGRYARVDAAGAYTRDAPSPDALFGVMMGALSGGRVGIAAVAVRQARVALAIAVRYGLLRRAFAGAPGAAETLLLDYPMHRRRLLPRLAITVVHQVVLNALKAGWSRSLGAKDCPVSSCGYRVGGGCGGGGVGGDGVLLNDGAGGKGRARADLDAHVRLSFWFRARCGRLLTIVALVAPCCACAVFRPLVCCRRRCPRPS